MQTETYQIQLRAQIEHCTGVTADRKQVNLILPERQEQFHSESGFIE